MKRNPLLKTGILTGLREDESRKAFSMVELLTVIGVISILMAISIFSIRGSGNSQRLRMAGDLIAGMATQARQYSLAQNTMTALVVLGASAPEESGLRSVGLFALRPTSGEWEQIAAWKQFSVGVIIDPSESTFFSPPSRMPSPSLPASLRVGGQSTTSYASQVYLPNGRLLDGESVTLKVIPGHLQGGQVVPTETANHLIVTLIASTGQTKVFQP